MQINVVVLLGLAFVWSPAEAQYGPVQSFLINCEAGLAHPDCPDSNITDDSIAAYSNFFSKYQPFHPNRVQREKGSKFNWHNPCAYPPGSFDIITADQNLKIPDSKKLMFESLITQAKIAQQFADSLKNQFAELEFGITSTELHRLWQHTCFYWLPSIEQIPKSLGKPLQWRYLYGILEKENSTLESCYRYLQFYAIAVEKITDDLKKAPKSSAAKEKLKTDFLFVERHLKFVLCDLEGVLIEYHLERILQHYVSPLIFPKHALLNLGDTFTAIRDWLIFRDYINYLEYLLEVADLYYTKVQLNP